METFELIRKLTDLRLDRVDDADDRHMIFEAETQLGVAAAQEKRIAELEQTCETLQRNLTLERKFMNETRERFTDALDAMRTVWP